MLAKLFAPLSMKVAAGIILALLIALATATIRANRAEAGQDRLRDRLATSEAQHAMTLASLDALVAEMEKLASDGELREATVRAALIEARREGDSARAEADAMLREIRDDCRPSDAILRSRNL